jgi:hypothetical protein
LKKLVGKEIEDALNRLDKLTQEEALMAAAEILRLTHIVDNKVTTVVNGTSGVVVLPFFLNMHLSVRCPTIGNQHR